MVYASSDQIGSPAKFYTLLQEASKKMPIARNHEGSYLTFTSVDGLVFAADLFVAGYACCWLDQACLPFRIAGPHTDSTIGVLATSHRVSSRELSQSLHLGWYCLV